MSDRPTHGSRNRLAATAAALAAAASVSADVTIAEWDDPDHFEFNVNYMPDLDQRRQGLLGNGSAFCVPTSTMNLFAYAADWGFPSLLPGPGVWQSDVSYSTMTDHLADLGVEMSTTGTGTGIAGWNDGTAAWIDGQPLTRHAIYRTATWTPTLSDAVRRTSYAGLVNICYGMYEFTPSAEPILGARTGGHCVTIARASSDGPGTLELWVRNPNNSSSLWSQEPWAYSIYDVQNMLLLHDWDNDGSFGILEGTVIGYDPDGNRLRLIDNVFAIYPAAGYSWSTVEVNVDPLVDDLWTNPPSQTFGQLPGLTYLDVAQSMDAMTYYVIAYVDPLGVLYEADPLTGAMTELAQIIDATDIAVGRDGRLYVAALNRLIVLDPDGSSVGVETLPGSYQAIAYRDATDEIVLVSSISQRMLVYDTDLDLVADHDLPGVPWSPDLSMAVRESDGTVALVLETEDDTLYGIHIELENVLISSYNVSSAGAVSVIYDDIGNLVVATDDGCVVELEESPPGSWSFDVVTPSIYDGMQSSGAFRVSKSRTNHDPVINAVDDIDLPAEQLEYTGTIAYDCPGDFDNDQQVGVNDLLRMLSKWGACGAGCPEDFDGNGTVGTNDLLALLAVWGACDI